MDFTVLRLPPGARLEIDALRVARNHSVHTLGMTGTTPEVLLVEELPEGYWLAGVRICDTFQAGLVKGGPVYTSPHDVMVYVYVSSKVPLLFVTTTNANYVSLLGDLLFPNVGGKPAQIDVSTDALQRLARQQAIAFYGADLVDAEGNRTHVDKRSELDSRVADSGDRIESVTITPRIESGNLFMLTVTSHGTFHTTCKTAKDLFEVLGLVEGLNG